MKPELLHVGPTPPWVVDGLKADFVIHPYVDANDKAALLAEVASGVRGAIASGEVGLRAELIDRLPKLEMIGTFGVGVDATDVAHAKSKGIVVTNTPDVLTEEVANTALALVLTATRRLGAAERYLRAGRWASDGPFPLAATVIGKRLGIVGLGRIGSAIAKRAEAVGMEVAYCGPNQKPVVYPYHADALALARVVDVLVVAAPGGPATQGLIDQEVLDALGPEGFLVNIGRGSVVDEDALVAALKAGRIAGAGLDVFANEPEVPAELRDMDNVVLWPHIGSATVATRRAMAELCVANVKAYFAGEPVLTPV